MSPPGPWQQVLVAAADPAGLRDLLPRAAAAARGADSTLRVLLVPPELPDLARVARRTGVTPEALVAQRDEEARATVRAGLAGLDLPRPPILELRQGTLFLEVIREVETHRCDLLVKSAERRAGPAARRLGDAFRASTDQHLLRKSPVPLWLVEPAGPPGPRCVLAAIDVDDGDSSEPETLAGLNERILVQLLGLAMLGAREIHLVHAWDAPGEGMLRRCLPPGEVAAWVLDYLHEVERGHRRPLEDLAAALRRSIDARGLTTVVEAHLSRGGARQVLPEAVRRLDADLLVMGTVGRSGIPGLLIGNTAEDVLNAVDCSLLAVKPPGFVCPLDL